MENSLKTSEIKSESVESLYAKFNDCRLQPEQDFVNVLAELTTGPKLAPEAKKNTIAVLAHNEHCMRLEDLLRAQLQVNSPKELVRALDSYKLRITNQNQILSLVLSEHGEADILGLVEKNFSLVMQENLRFQQLSTLDRAAENGPHILGFVAGLLLLLAYLMNRSYLKTNNQPAPGYFGIMKGTFKEVFSEVRDNVKSNVEAFRKRKGQ